MTMMMMMLMLKFNVDAMVAFVRRQVAPHTTCDGPRRCRTLPTSRRRHRPTTTTTSSLCMAVELSTTRWRGTLAATASRTRAATRRRASRAATVSPSTGDRLNTRCSPDSSARNDPERRSLTRRQSLVKTKFHHTIQLATSSRAGLRPARGLVRELLASWTKTCVCTSCACRRPNSITLSS